jgi:hypothetical protein
MKSKKISNYYSKLRKIDKDHKDNGHFEDQGNAAFIMLLLRYMGYKKPFKDYNLLDIPSAEVYTCAETGDWSKLLSFIKESEEMSDVLKKIPKLDITDKILEQMESKIDLLMDYIEVENRPGLAIRIPWDEFLESIV